MTINITFASEIDDTLVSTDFENESSSLIEDIEEDDYVSPKSDEGVDVLSSSGDMDYGMLSSSLDDIDLSSLNEDKLSADQQGTFLELYLLVGQNQGETLVLEKDYSFSSMLDSSFTNGIPINHSMTIDGNGHTIDAKYKARMF